MQQTIVGCISFIPWQAVPVDVLEEVDSGKEESLPLCEGRAALQMPPASAFEGSRTSSDRALSIGS
jgi:hypothetical protein